MRRINYCWLVCFVLFNTGNGLRFRNTQFDIKFIMSYFSMLLTILRNPFIENTFCLRCAARNSCSIFVIENVIKERRRPATILNLKGYGPAYVPFNGRTRLI